MAHFFLQHVQATRLVDGIKKQLSQTRSSLAQQLRRLQTTHFMQSGRQTQSQSRSTIKAQQLQDRQLFTINMAQTHIIQTAHVRQQSHQSQFLKELVTHLVDITHPQTVVERNISLPVVDLQTAFTVQSLQTQRFMQSGQSIHTI